MHDEEFDKTVCLTIYSRKVQIWLPIPLPLPESIFQPIRCAGPTRLTNQIVEKSGSGSGRGSQI